MCIKDIHSYVCMHMYVSSYANLVNAMRISRSSIYYETMIVLQYILYHNYRHVFYS